MNTAHTQEVLPALEQAAQPLAVVQQSEAGALMTIIERISTMPELDLDRVERLFAMHQQMLAKQAEKEFNDAMALTQGRIQSVVVDRENAHTHSWYATLDAIHEKAKPIWTASGFSVVSRIADSAKPDHIKVICEVRNGSHKEVHEKDWPLDTAGAKGGANKTAIQGMGSTSTYARRYTELMIFDIAIKGMDKDGNNNIPELTQKAADWLAYIQECTDMNMLQKRYAEAFRDLQNVKDGYGTNQLNKAKDAKKKELSNA
jgi:hypothetical protein